MMHPIIISSNKIYNMISLKIIELSLIKGSQAYVLALEKTGLVTDKERKDIYDGLEKVWFIYFIFSINIYKVISNIIHYSYMQGL